MKLNEVNLEGMKFRLFSHELKKDCSAYVRLMNVAAFDTTFPLIKGANYTQDFGKHPIRTDRKPLDGIMVLDAMYDYYAERDVGVKAIRERSSFVTGSHTTASKYGFPVLVFPMDGSRYFYSPNVKDSYGTKHALGAYLSHAVKQSIPEVEGFCKANGILLGVDPSNKADFFDAVYKAASMSTDLQRYLFALCYQIYPHAVDLQEVSSMSDLPSLMNKGIEIMVYGALYFYFVQPSYLSSYFHDEMATTQDAFPEYIHALETGDWSEAKQS